MKQTYLKPEALAFKLAPGQALLQSSGENLILNSALIYDSEVGTGFTELEFWD